MKPLYRYECGTLYAYSEKNAAYLCVFVSTCRTKSGAVRAYQRALDKEQCTAWIAANADPRHQLR